MSTPKSTTNITTSTYKIYNFVQIFGHPFWWGEGALHMIARLSTIHGWFADEDGYGVIFSYRKLQTLDEIDWPFSF